MLFSLAIPIASSLGLQPDTVVVLRTVKRKR
jgi:hypothetical protein